MPVAKVTISIDASLLRRVDLLVSRDVFQNRSQAIQSAVAEKISKVDKNRLAVECTKLNKKEEQEFADSGLVADLNEWPEY